ncbi:MAG TPA: ubiquinone/menaquinone biosynthesis methyltransferase [Bacillota bacterium]
MKEALEARQGKELYVHNLFAAIAHHYDVMNMVMSAGMLRLWQRAFAARTGLQPGGRALDVCAGTAELSLVMARQVGSGGQVTGIDFSPEMLEVGRAKAQAARAGVSGLAPIELVEGDALALPFAADRFDCAATGFALRNVKDVPGAVAEMVRVVRPGGRVVSLELSKPLNPFIREPYYLYFYHVVPILGWIIDPKTERRLRAYGWLPKSLIPFPTQDGLADIFRRAGLVDVGYRGLTGGIVSVHWGTKPS